MFGGMYRVYMYESMGLHFFIYTAFHSGCCSVTGPVQGQLRVREPTNDILVLFIT
jgi:hypothetical protein